MNFESKLHVVVRGLAFLIAAGGWLLSTAAVAGDNFIDYRVKLDTSGIFATGLQDAVPVALTLASAGCALWQGTESRIGKTCWESSESIAIAGLSTLALKAITRRRSPAETSNPNQWFSGGSGSFPSLHLSGTTAAITPFILQYFKDDPWVATLALLPIYEGVARVKAREHWQTDVIAGALLGFGVGYFEYAHNSPLVFNVLPGGAFVGFQRIF